MDTDEKINAVNKKQKKGAGKKTPHPLFILFLASSSVHYVPRKRYQSHAEQY